MKPHRAEGMPHGVRPFAFRKFSDRRYPMKPNRRPRTKKMARSEPL
jgi:hypothetical protein